MEKKYIVFLIIVLSSIIILSFSINQSYQVVCIKERCFKIEIAQSQEERERGLMFRQALKEDEGMLFIFPSEEFHSFWMKNTLIPLDIIWINKENKIVYIQHNALPCTSDPCPSYTSKQKAIYVLEINAGFVEKYNFEEGDKITIK